MAIVLQNDESRCHVQPLDRLRFTPRDVYTMSLEHTVMTFEGPICLHCRQGIP